MSRSLVSGTNRTGRTRPVSDSRRPRSTCVRWMPAVSSDRVSIEEAQCLCNCEGAPMMSVGGKYETDLTEKKIDQIVDGLK